MSAPINLADEITSMLATNVRTGVILAKQRTTLLQTPASEDSALIESKLNELKGDIERNAGAFQVLHDLVYRALGGDVADKIVDDNEA